MGIQKNPKTQQLHITKIKQLNNGPAAIYSCIIIISLKLRCFGAVTAKTAASSDKQCFIWQTVFGDKSQCKFWQRAGKCW